MGRPLATLLLMVLIGTGAAGRAPSPAPALPATFVPPLGSDLSPRGPRPRRSTRSGQEQTAHPRAARRAARLP